MKGLAKRRLYAWQPQPGPQADAISATWCEELFFGGARGGGKSDFLLGDFLQDVARYGANWQGILFRRTYPELAEIIGRSQRLFPITGAVWKEADKEWHWPNGAKLRMRYVERYADVSRYQGHQYTWMGFDELTNWSDARIYQELKACLRWADADVPTKRIRCSGNPGGPGHGWVKSYFIDHAPGGYLPRICEQTKHSIMFIPSRVQDNQILLERDPGYVDRLRGVGSEALVRAWLEGDWSAVVGAYFAEFGLQHLIDPFPIPRHWIKFRALDWGSARPFCVLWCAVADGEHVEGVPDLPRDTLVVYREWYGSSAPNVGLKLHVPDVAAGIVARSYGEDYAYSVADPACFQQDGGPSIAETFNRHGVNFRPADNKRLAGWQQVRDRLVGLDGRPLLLLFANCCKDLIRTLPTLQHDSAKPEDLDTEAEDHAADTLRYACMSRPYSAPVKKVPEPKFLPQMTLNDLWKAQADRTQGRTRI